MDEVIHWKGVKMAKITAKVKIDPEFAKMIESTDPEALASYLKTEISKMLADEMKKIWQKEVDKVLYGVDEDGKINSPPEPTGISFPIWQESMKKLGFPRPLRKTIWSDIDGGWTYEPSSLSLLDFNYMHPSMWIDYAKAMKPKNKYERMMRRRRK